MASRIRLRRLLVLQKGNVAEAGTHAALLLNPDGEFRPYGRFAGAANSWTCTNAINQITTQAVGG